MVKVFIRIVYAYMTACGTLLSLSTKRQICSFVRPISNEFKFDIMNIQCQENMNDCGLAYATELVYGEDPCFCHFQTEVMRSHLMKYLESGVMERFPLKKRRRVGLGKRIKQTVLEKIFCDCRMPNDKNLSMEMCNICAQWYHHKCLGESISDDPKTKWHCKFLLC